MKWLQTILNWLLTSKPWFLDIFANASNIASYVFWFLLEYVGLVDGIVMELLRSPLWTESAVTRLSYCSSYNCKFTSSSFNVASGYLSSGFLNFLILYGYATALQYDYHALNWPLTPTYLNLVYFLSNYNYPWHAWIEYWFCFCCMIFVQCLFFIMFRPFLTFFLAFKWVATGTALVFWND